MRGVSDSVMLGQLCAVGTGHCDMLLDETRLAETIPVGAAAVDALAVAAFGSGMSGLTFGQTPIMASPTAYSPESHSVYGGAASPGPQFSPTVSVRRCSAPLTSRAIMHPFPSASRQGNWTPDVSATPAFSPGPNNAFGFSPGAASPAYPMSPASSNMYRAAMSPGYTPSAENTPTSPAYRCVLARVCVVCVVDCVEKLLETTEQPRSYFLAIHSFLFALYHRLQSHFACV
jgi:hypothetical protein